MNHIPPLSYDLIDLLDTVYPVVLPSYLNKREEELYKAGQRSVIDFLIQLQKEQEESKYVV